MTFFRVLPPFFLFAALLAGAHSTADGRQHPDPVRAQNGMVVSAMEDASRVGVEVLNHGGNAVDASVATGFALAVVYPVAGNIGGGGFMVIRLADGTSTTVDYREKAPAASTRDMFIDEEGEFRPDWSQKGYLASGVPGSVAGLLHAHERYGKLPLAEVMSPAIRLAEEGFHLTRRQANLLNRWFDNFSEFPSTAEYFTKGDRENRYEEGELFVQSDLAETLKRIRDDGRDGFYRGKTADLIIAEMERGGGLITHEDLAAYEAVEREPITGTYRDHHVISMPPPSSGGVALIQLLNAMENHDPAAKGFNSSAAVHLMGEAMRRVYADRAEWLGDPDFFPVPVAELTDKSYMRERMHDFDPWQVTPSAEVEHGDPYAFEVTETTHYSVVDREGNAVSTTTTINGAFGSRVVVDGAGFFLNNEMDDFAAAPGVPNMFGLIGSEANAIEPGKRMLSSMTPTILEDPEGRLFMVIGSPGGARIITTVFQVVLNVIDHDMDIQEAVSVPRIHHQWLPDEITHERFALARDVIENLEQRGWEVNRMGYSGRADGILVGYEHVDEFIDPSGLDVTRIVERERWYFGGADPRGEDVAVGY